MSGAVHFVLEQPQLLELILDYCVHDANIDLRNKTLSSLRLVNSKWLNALTSLMQQKKEPIYKLTLNKDNSLNETPFVQTHGKLLDRFVTALGSRLEEQLPTISLKIRREYFVQENYESLLTFLRRYGMGIVHLTVTFPISAPILSFPELFPYINLANLQTILVGPMSGSILPTFASFLQFLLVGANSLKNFLIPLESSELSPQFEYLVLPKSIEKLQLCCVMNVANIEFLVRQNLPNLKYLQFAPLIQSYQLGVFSRILENFAENMKGLYISHNFQYNPTLQQKPSNLLHFPKMPKLEKLFITNIGIELDTNHPSISNCFPVLRDLKLLHQTPEMLQKWTRVSAPLTTVTSLELYLVDESKQEGSLGYTLPIKAKSLKAIHLALPNLTELILRLSGAETCGLKYIFMEMRQLKTLRITVYDAESILSENLWDSIFIGAPVGIVQALRENPDCWDSLEFNDNASSVRMLAALQYLELNVFPNYPVSWQILLISDLTFSFSLLKMPGLKSLTFGGRFNVSDWMITKWKELGRKIQFTS